MSSLTALYISSAVFAGELRVAMLLYEYVMLGLNLTDSFISGSIPPEIGNMTNLVSLNLQNDNFSGPIPLEIGNLVNLVSLTLRQNCFVGSRFLQHSISIYRNPFYLNMYTVGTIPATIGNLSLLTYLALMENSLTGIAAS